MRAAALLCCAGAACGFRGAALIGDAPPPLDAHDAMVDASLDAALDAAIDGPPIDGGATCATGSWCFRKAIAIPAASVMSTTNLSGFDLLVHLTDAELAANTRADAADLYFADAAGTKLNYERQHWDPLTGDLVAWVRVPSLPVAGTVIYVYYGNPTHGTDGQSVGPTWGSMYRGVWHLEEAGAPFKDSSGNGNTGAAANGLVAGTPGQIGNALTFDGVSAMLLVAASTSLDTTGLETTATISMWIQMPLPVTDHFQTIMSTGNRFSTAEDGFEWATQSVAGGSGYYFYPWAGDGSDFNIITPSPVPAAAWHYVAVELDANATPRTVKFFVDGVAMNPTANNVGTLWTQTAVLTSFLFGWNPDAPGAGFLGMMDEIRIATAIRNAGFLRTEWANQSDPSAFYKVGVQESL